MRTKREMFHIAAAISIVVMLVISPIMIGKAYSVEYTGQVTCTGNDVQSEYIIIKLWRMNENGTYTELTTESFSSPKLSSNYKEGESDSTWYINESYSIIPEYPETFISVEYPSNPSSTTKYKIGMTINLDDIATNGFVTSNVTTEEPEYNNKGEIESYKKIDELKIGIKYRIRATISFNMLPINKDMPKLIAKFTLDSKDDYKSAQYTENKKELYVNEPTIITPEIIIAGKITESLNQYGSGFRATADENGEIYIHAAEDYGMTTGSYTQEFEASFSIEDNMSFYLHIYLEKGLEIINNTNIEIGCTVGTEEYDRFTLSDKTDEKGIYLGLKKGSNGSMIKIDSLDGNYCFVASPNEKIVITIKGKEAGVELFGYNLMGYIKFSIVPYP